MIQKTWSTDQFNINLVESAADIPASDLVGFDIETTPRPEFMDKADIPPDPRLHKIVLAQIGLPDGNVYVLHRNFESLKDLLENPDVVKVSHSAAFEKKHMLHSSNVGMKNTFDTQLVESVLEAGHKPDLHLTALTKKYLDTTLDKAVRERFINGARIDRKMIEYAARDAWVMPKLYDSYIAIMQDNEYEALHKVLSLEHKLQDAVVDMELNGFYLHKPSWEALAIKNEAAFAQIRIELLRVLPSKTKRFNIFGDTVSDINLNSRDTVIKLLDVAGVSLPDLKKETIADAIQTIDNPILTMYSKYIKLQKAVSTYGFTFLNNINPVTGRVHQSVRQLEARTGRLAGSGPNLMNIPKGSDFRSCFMAEEGNVLVSYDYSQQELRILAEISGDKGMIEAFEKGIDFHLHVARILFRDPTIPAGDPKKGIPDDPRRSIAKNINFGLIYGMGTRRLAKVLKISVHEAEDLMQMHAESFPVGFEWMQDTIAFAKQHGYVETLLGRRRYLDTEVHDYEGQARNTPIQGSGADMTKLALLYVFQAGLFLVNVVHDEICVECKNDIEIIKETQEIMEVNMMKAANSLVKKVPFAVTGTYGKVWSKA